MYLSMFVFGAISLHNTDLSYTSMAATNLPTRGHSLGLVKALLLSCGMGVVSVVSASDWALINS